MDPGLWINQECLIFDNWLFRTVFMVSRSGDGEPKVI